MKLILSIVFISILGIGTQLKILHSSEQINDNMSLIELQGILGWDLSDKKINNKIVGVSAEIGEDIVKYGSSNRNGQKKSKQQSAHFVCTSCHNIVREDPNLANINPEDRLKYAIDSNLPYLPGTALWGVINRDSFYNGDYKKKYGDLIKPARTKIRGAIQLCAIECAQGRRLEEREIESIVAYLHSIQIMVGDLQLSNEEKIFIEEAIKGDDQQKAKGLKLLKSKYTQVSQATLLPKPDKDMESSKANAANGMEIYNRSCLHCHKNGRYSFLHLNMNKMSRKFLQNHLSPVWNKKSIYQVMRYGTIPVGLKKSYMPFYTKEKMTDSQLADLRAYIVS